MENLKRGIKDYISSKFKKMKDNEKSERIKDYISREFIGEQKIIMKDHINREFTKEQKII